MIDPLAFQIHDYTTGITVASTMNRRRERKADAIMGNCSADIAAFHSHITSCHIIPNCILVNADNHSMIALSKSQCIPKMIVMIMSHHHVIDVWQVTELS